MTNIESAIIGQASKERMTVELYQLRPAWDVTFGGDVYVTSGEAERRNLPEWQRARDRANQWVDLWQLEGRVDG